MYETLAQYEEHIRNSGTGDAPGSRYGCSAWNWVPVAAAASYIVDRETGESTPEGIDYVVGLVVNDSDDIGYVISVYGPLYDIDPEDYGIDPADYLKEE